MKVPDLHRGQRVSGNERDRLSGKLLRQYQSGKSIRQICAATGYSIGRVRRLLIEADVEFRPRGGSNRRKR